jgi:hypothetical protein
MELVETLIAIPVLTVKIINQVEQLLQATGLLPRDRLLKMTEQLILGPPWPTALEDRVWQFLERRCITDWNTYIGLVHDLFITRGEAVTTRRCRRLACCIKACLASGAVTRYDVLAEIGQWVIDYKDTKQAANAQALWLYSGGNNQDFIMKELTRYQRMSYMKQYQLTWRSIYDSFIRLINIFAQVCPQGWDWVSPAGDTIIMAALPL